MEESLPRAEEFDPNTMNKLTKKFDIVLSIDEADELTKIFENAFNYSMDDEDIAAAASASIASTMVAPEFSAYASASNIIDVAPANSASASSSIIIDVAPSAYGSNTHEEIAKSLTDIIKRDVVFLGSKKEVLYFVNAVFNELKAKFAPTKQGKPRYLSLSSLIANTEPEVLALPNAPDIFQSLMKNATASEMEIIAKLKKKIPNFLVQFENSFKSKIVEYYAVQTETFQVRN